MPLPEPPDSHRPIRAGRRPTPRTRASAGERHDPLGGGRGRRGYRRAGRRVRTRDSRHRPARRARPARPPRQRHPYGHERRPPARRAGARADHAGAADPVGRVVSGTSAGSAGAAGSSASTTALPADRSSHRRQPLTPPPPPARRHAETRHRGPRPGAGHHGRAAHRRSGPRSSDALLVLRAELAAIDAACSRFRPDSELSRANATAGTGPVPVSALLAEAVETSPCAPPSSPTAPSTPRSGPAVVALGYDRTFAQVAARPEDTGPATAPRPAAGWRTVRWDPALRLLRLPAGTTLDLGATAKALAADRAARRAAAAAGCGVLVNLGGDLSAAGRAAGRRLAGRDRRRPRGPGRRARTPGGLDPRRRPGHLRHHRTDLAARRPDAAPHRRPGHRRRPAARLAHRQRRRRQLRGRQHGQHRRARARRPRPRLAARHRPARPAGPHRRKRAVPGRLARRAEAADERRRPARVGSLGPEPALVRHPGGRNRLPGPADRHGRARHRGGGTLRARASGPVRGVGTAPQPVAAHPGVPGTAHRHRRRRQLSPTSPGRQPSCRSSPPTVRCGWAWARWPWTCCWRSLVTSAVRGRLGRRRWKAVHWLAYAAWPVALFHAVGTGTDTRLGPQLALYAGCLLAVVAAVWWRLVRAGRGPSQSADGRRQPGAGARGAGRVPGRRAAAARLGSPRGRYGTSPGAVHRPGGPPPDAARTAAPARPARRAPPTGRKGRTRGT